MRITVLGASGIQGRHQIHSLALSNHTVIAASRTPPALPPHPSVTHIATDFTNPEDIHFAVQGVDRVFVNLPSTSFAPAEPILDAARVVGEACKRAGVGLIVFNTSMPIPLQTQNIKAQDDRREIRRLLRASGVPVISIEPVVYLDNLLEGWAVRALREENKVVYCHKPDLRVSWVCHHDVATIMCAAMHKLDWGTQERNIRVGGPETVVLSELTAKLSHAWSKPLTHECQSVPDFCDKIGQSMAGRGLDIDTVKSQMFKAYTYYNEAEDEPFRVDMGPLSEELGVGLTEIEEWAGRRSAWVDKGYF